MGPQAVEPQGAKPQGVKPQGVKPQGVWLGRSGASAQGHVEGEQGPGQGAKVQSARRNRRNATQRSVSTEDQTSEVGTALQFSGTLNPADCQMLLAH